MSYQVGDYVTRESHQHDVVFIIVKIKNETAFLKGVCISCKRINAMIISIIKYIYKVLVICYS